MNIVACCLPKPVFWTTTLLSASRQNCWQKIKLFWNIVWCVRSSSYCYQNTGFSKEGVMLPNVGTERSMFWFWMIVKLLKKEYFGFWLRFFFFFFNTLFIDCFLLILPVQNYIFIRENFISMQISPVCIAGIYLLYFT